MNAKPPISVLCVDDHPSVRDGIAYALSLQPDMVLVGSAATGHEALTLFREHRPDITLMDLQLPDINGVDVMIKIHEKDPQARFIVLTTYAGDVQASRALRAGARGYLLKSTLRKELTDAIRAVHAGLRRITAEVASSISEHLAGDELTARELDVLRAVAGGRSNKAVASDLAISEETVKGHMKNILSKLQANDRTHAILIAFRRGVLDG